MPPCQDTSVNVKHDGSGRHRGKGPGEAAICPLSLKHLGHVLSCARNVGQRSTKSAEDPGENRPKGCTQDKIIFNLTVGISARVIFHESPATKKSACDEDRFEGGMHKGAQPSCGGSRRTKRDNGFGWRAACRGVGGTRPPRFAPGGGNGKGGDQTPGCRRRRVRIPFQTRS